jgi:hypothetical protein
MVGVGQLHFALNVKLAQNRSLCALCRVVYSERSCAAGGHQSDS